MKTIYLVLTFLLINAMQLVYSQNDAIVLTKSNQANVCGKIVLLYGLWLDGETIRADVSILETERSKPIIGGYKVRDKILISDNCYLFLNEIDTNGFSEDKGTIKLSPDDYKLIIRKVPLQRKMNEPPYDDKICLLKVYFYSKIEMARPVIEHIENGIKAYLVYDVIKTFDSEDEALIYAKENNIRDVNVK